MSFEAPLLLALAPLVALFIAAGAWLARGRRIRLARSWSDALGREARSRGRWAPLVLGIVALLAALALAGPRWGSASVTTETRALSVVLAVDISRSMLAEDASPSRL
jgi:Ca-activated chloride channel homolog